eukprot:6504722-Alexandrium_andersonii.AAC.1
MQHTAALTARHAPRPPAGPQPGRARRSGRAGQLVARPAPACTDGCVAPSGRAGAAPSLSAIVAGRAKPSPPA